MSSIGDAGQHHLVRKRHLVVLGAGSIGISFAAVFRDAGWSVSLADPDADRLGDAASGIALQIAAITSAGLLRGGAGEIAFTADPSDALARADLVIECGPERLEIKQQIFADLLAKTGPECILATASSAIPASQILPDPAQQRRCLVAHPVNPPAVLRVIEICPAPGTDPAVTARAGEFFAQAGFHAVLLGHEIEGFVLNRLQGAVLREAYRLVDEGVVDVAGLEAIMRLGLAPRWALSGPFETAELNTPGGIRAHAARMGPAYARMGAERGEAVDWHEALISRVETERRAMVAADDLAAKRDWRAASVAKLVAARDALMGPNDER
ncbi:3-hydroxyacyl-CoA dehydrogenase NAD-binding domain-containing protein [Paracoccus aminophilus]|uniref:3-hydroxyacyl-CoA dehydrogenase n=1 Tax=Paracoccus aminophilus JCM 7686 TaxID=1367847 RepID=S5Z034_PARAH|nr:3-hydroxyacyl-CoA dehydrogenase NAD-binding domain-containing protein [Paracoccus aminophilus]AGT10826.1 3-hydroxyacyl-CoA dehydrogenase [Paracoccus aminophilus JCM 7686]